jgi:hypothetical protein
MSFIHTKTQLKIVWGRWLIRHWVNEKKIFSRADVRSGTGVPLWIVGTCIYTDRLCKLCYRDSGSREVE